MSSKGKASLRAASRRHVRKIVALGSTLAVALAMEQVPVMANAAAEAHLSASTPQHGGTLDVVAATLQANLAPTQAGVANEDTSSSGGAIYGYLGYVNAKDGAVELSFLKSITPSKDQRTWTLVLHSGIKFSDDTPLNAAAIAYTIAQQANPNNGDSNYKIEATWKTHVVNPTTLTIKLPTADAGFAAEMTQDFPYIGSPTAWAKEGINFATQPVGAGPFKIESWTQNAQLTLVPNPYYKDFAPGQPYLDKIVFNQASQTDPTQLIAAIVSHSDQAGWLEGSSEFTKARAAGYNLQTTTSSGGQFLTFNTAAPPFNNILAREAVSDALDAQELASVWSPGTTAFHNLFATTSPYFDRKYNFQKQDSTKAKQLFSELQAKGVNMNFSFVTVTAFPETADYLQATLDKYPGVHVKIVLATINSYIQDGKDGNFGMFAFGVNFTNPWPDVSTYFGKNGSANFGKWNDPKVSQALKVISVTQNPTILKREYLIISKEVASQLPIVPAQGSELGYTWAKNVQNVHTIEYGVTPLFAQIWLQ